ncbi:MAG: UbiX family flavin prenyltransferase [Planctomycetes bacterium]|nr:UbiX family flavin prenyltransferase [Planctomycetota bacterium]
MADAAAPPRTFVVGISGGSGAPYALRLIEVLLRAGARVEVVVSDAGRRVLQFETGVVGPGETVGARHLAPPPLRDRLVVHDLAAVESTPASGSARIDGVVLCPCSMGTVARVAHGFSTNLLERAADVALKEGRRLIVVPRETPLSAIHLRNMLALVEAGAVVLPAMPGFYHRPTTVAQLVDFVVARILDKLGVDHDLVERWHTPATGGDGSPWNEGEVIVDD